MLARALWANDPHAHEVFFQLAQVILKGLAHEQLDDERAAGFEILLGGVQRAARQVERARDITVVDTTRVRRHIAEHQVGPGGA